MLPRRRITESSFRVMEWFASPSRNRACFPSTLSSYSFLFYPSLCTFLHRLNFHRIFFFQWNYLFLLFFGFCAFSFDLKFFGSFFRFIFHFISSCYIYIYRDILFFFLFLFLFDCLSGEKSQMIE